MESSDLIIGIAIILTIMVLAFFVTQSSCSTCKTLEEFHDGIVGKDDFDVYLINMTKNKDRLDAFVKLYLDSDLNFKGFYRFEAVDGRKLNLEDYVSTKALNEIQDAEKNGYREKHYQLTRGGVGCYLSHQSVIRIIRDSKKKFGIVFEDDATFSPNIYAKLTERLKEIPTDWDILLLGCYCIRCHKYAVYKDIDRFFQTHGLVISSDGAQKVTEYLDSIKIEQQIDTVLSIMIEKNLLKVYCLNDDLATQDNNFDTTIQLPIQYKQGINPFSVT